MFESQDNINVQKASHIWALDDISIPSPYLITHLVEDLICCLIIASMDYFESFWKISSISISSWQTLIINYELWCLLLHFVVYYLASFQSSYYRKSIFMYNSGWDHIAIFSKHLHYPDETKLFSIHLQVFFLEW